MALHPLVDLLRRHLGIDESDSATASAEKIDRGVAALGEDLEAVAPYLRALLSVAPGDNTVAAMSPQQRRGDAGRTEAVPGPGGCGPIHLIVVIEDLHWIDTASEQFLRAILDGVPSLRVLLVFTYRPGYPNPLRRSLVLHADRARQPVAAGDRTHGRGDLLTDEGLPAGSTI